MQQYIVLAGSSGCEKLIGQSIDERVGDRVKIADASDTSAAPPSEIERKKPGAFDRIFVVRRRIDEAQSLVNALCETGLRNRV